MALVGNVGRGYSIQAQIQADNIDKCDIKLIRENGSSVMTITEVSTDEYIIRHRFNYEVKNMTRIMCLLDNRDMAAHNAMCYGRHWGEEPKEGYEEKWWAEIDKKNMLCEWIDELLLQYDGDGYNILKEEFN